MFYRHINSTGIRSHNKLKLLINILILFINTNCLLIWSGKIFYPLSIGVVFNIFANLILICIFYKFRHSQCYGKRILFIYVGWIIVTLFRSIYYIENKKEITFLCQNSSAILLVTTTLMFIHISYIRKYYHLYFKYGIPLFIVLAGFMMPGCWGWYLCPVLLLFIFYKRFQSKWRLFIILLLIVSIIDVTTRSNLIRGFSAVACMYVFFLFHKKKYYTSLCKIMSISLIFAPFVFLLLGITGIFNIFEFRTDDRKQNQLYADTRTNVYQEVINSSTANNYILFGRTFSKGYDSVYEEQFTNTRQKTERRSEVSICNIYTWMGLTGVVLYFLCFCVSLYHSVFKSNNAYIKIIGVFLATRWPMAFIEDINNLDPINITIFITMSICLNPRLTNINNAEFVYLIKTTFQKKNDISWGMARRY